MPLLLDVRPGVRRAFVRTFELDGLAVRIRLRWMPRLGRWLAELLDATDGLLSVPQLVQPGGTIVHDVADPRLPAGELHWLGPDDYKRADLGDSLRLVYVEPAVETRPDVNTLLRVQP